MGYRGRHQKTNRYGCLGRILTFLILLVLLTYPFIEPYLLEVESVTVLLTCFEVA